jgi:hypothetical protein
MVSEEPAQTPKPKDGEPGHVENPPLPPSFQTVCGYNLMSRWDRPKRKTRTRWNVSGSRLERG